MSRQDGAVDDMLELEAVTKTFGTVAAVVDVELTLAAGETVALIGPSGCGKSTLLQLAIGLVRPDRGLVRLEGRPLGEAATLRAHRRRMGYVIQSGGLFPHLTAYENVALPARPARWPTDRVSKRIETLAALVQLPTSALDRYPSQLSGGQRQRVSLMRALLLDPDVLLLDEPMGALDPMIRHDLQQELRGIVRSLGTTVLLVTHDLAEAAFFTDRLVLLRDGAMVQTGTLRDLSETPIDDFVARFVTAQRGPDACRGPDR